jgi:hypothetical protein
VRGWDDVIEHLGSQGSNDGIGQSNDRRAFCKDELRRAILSWATSVTSSMHLFHTLLGSAWPHTQALSNKVTATLTDEGHPLPRGHNRDFAAAVLCYSRRGKQALPRFNSNVHSPTAQLKISSLGFSWLRGLALKVDQNCWRECNICKTSTLE